MSGSQTDDDGSCCWFISADLDRDEIGYSPLLVVLSGHSFQCFFYFILIFHFSSQLKTSLVVKRVSSEWFFISFFGPEREKKSVDELFPETTVGRHRSRKGCEVSLDKTSATEPFRRQVFHSTPLLENGDSCVLKVLLL